MTDAQLIEKLRVGNYKAFKMLFDRYYPLMCAVAFEYVKDKHISQHISEDVMLAIWEKKDTFEVSVSLKYYLLTSVRNRSIDYLRSHSKDIMTIGYDYLSSEICFTPDEEIFERIVTIELEEKLEESILKMPDETRRVFIMSRYDDKSYTEIAEELNISVNTVKYHIKRALAVLRDELKDYILFCIITYSYLFYH